MRIGELLVQQLKLRQGDLQLALPQVRPGKRLGSILIEAGRVSFDDVSRALGELRGVPAALQKHLDNRDPELAKLLDGVLARASCALPLGKSSSGAIVIAVRDPSPALLANLRAATMSDVVMVIAPASRLEQLIAKTYPASEAEEFDVDFASSLNLTPAPRPSTFPPPIADMDLLDPDSVRLALTDLDDVRVDKDPSQSGQIPKVGSSTLPPPSARPASASNPGPLLPPRPPTQPGLANPASSQPGFQHPGSHARFQRPSTAPAIEAAAGSAPRHEPPPSPTLPTTRAALEQATNRDAATEHVIACLGGKWSCGVVLAVRGARAIAYRGITPPLEGTTIPLDAPSTVQRAIETRRTAVQDVDSPAQQQLRAVLGASAQLTAAPVMVSGDVVAVIAAAAPRHDDTDAAVAELGALAQALGAAYQRILAR